MSCLSESVLSSAQCETKPTRPKTELWFDKLCEKDAKQDLWWFWYMFWGYRLGIYHTSRVTKWQTREVKAFSSLGTYVAEKTWLSKVSSKKRSGYAVAKGRKYHRFSRRKWSEWPQPNIHERRFMSIFNIMNISEAWTGKTFRAYASVLQSVQTKTP